MTEHARDPDHWLFRLTGDEWLRAAENELRAAEQALVHKQRRAGVAGARRAAGMACNAVLSTAPDERYGRSYMDHLRALAVDEIAPAPVREAAARLLGAPLQIDVVPLGPGDASLARDAAAIVAHARERVRPTASA